MSVKKTDIDTIQVNGEQQFFVTNILQNLYFYVLQKKENHTGL